MPRVFDLGIFRHDSAAQSEQAELKRQFETASNKLVSDLSQQIEEFMHTQTTDLVSKDKRVKALKEQIDALAESLTKSLGRPLSHPEQKRVLVMHQTLEDQLQPIVVYLKQNEDELNGQEKWLKFGFPESALVNHADCVKFMMESGFGFHIEMFKKTTKAGMASHQIQQNAAGEPMIKMGGAFRPWSKIKELMEFDKDQVKVLSKQKVQNKDENPEQQVPIAYNYISPMGIVAADRIPSSLYPIEQLDKQDQQTLMTEARKFWNSHPEIDPGQEKECILQISTTGNYIAPDSPLTRGLNDVNPNHTSLRIIDKDGQVYSFGAEMVKEFERFAFAKMPRNFISAGFGKVATPDYQECRTFDIRRITSIPMTSKRMTAILEFVKETNKDDGMRFSFNKQNCNKFACCIAQLAGVNIDTRTTFDEVIGRAMPPLEAIPAIGKPLARLCRLIRNVVDPIFKFFAKHTPQPIKKTLRVVNEVLFFVPHKMKTLIFNLLVIYLGGKRQFKPQKEGDAVNEAMDSSRLIRFPRVITSWKDLFVDEKSDSNHSFKLNDWQERQASTRIHRREETPNMHIVA